MHVHFSATLDAPGRMRAVLGRVLADHPQRDIAQLAASEVVTNAIRHGDASTGEPLELSVVVDEAEVRIEVRNPATSSFDSRTVAPLEAGSAAGGWGLGLVAAVSEQWGVGRDDGRTLVWFVL